MKKLFIFLGVVVVLLIAAYFVVTSSGFIKAVVLPRVGAALNAEVRAETVTLSPFSSVELRNVTVVPNGSEQLASADLARVRYDLWAMMRGNMNIDEILLSNPTVTVVRKADGTSNLDPILTRMNEQSRSQTSKKPSDEPVRLDLKSLRVENGTLSYRAAASDGSEMTAQVIRFALTVRDIRNGGQGRIEYGAGLRFDQRPSNTPGGTGLGTIQGQVDGAYDVAFSPSLAPVNAAGRAEVQIKEAAGTFADYQGFSSVLSLDLAPTELKRLAIEFARAGAGLGSLTASGPLDLTKKEGQLRVNLNSIDRNVLNLVGTPMGLDFGNTRFDSTNEIDLVDGGQRIAVRGSLIGSQVGVKKAALSMPPVDLKEVYELAIDLRIQSASIKAFSLTANQNGREILRGNLAQPMEISWSPTHGPLPDATMDLQLNDLRIQEWSALIGSPAQGSLSARATIGVRQAGRDLALEANATLAGLTGTFAGNGVTNLGMVTVAKAAVSDYADSAKRRIVTNLKVDNLNGQAAVLRFDRFGADATADIGLPQGEVLINDSQIRLRRQTADAGSVSLKGRWNLDRGAGDLGFTAKEVNQDALRPFLQAALGDKELRKGIVNADATLKIDPASDSLVKATADVKDLVVHDPSGTVPETPLAAGLVLDAGGSNGKLAIRRGELRLTPTARASNQLTLTGDLDYSKTNALKGNLKLASEALDVTPYYEIFAGGASATNQPAPPVGSTNAPMQEPEAIQLPIELLTVEAALGHLYLREIDVQNLATTLTIRGSQVELQPLRLALNGAPVNGSLRLNLGVPGYEYDVKVTADQVPVKPFADSFVPLLKGRMGGAAKAALDVKGAGVTGVNLKKTLGGSASLSVTNANLKLQTGSRKGVLGVLTGVLATALNIRELQEQPIMDIEANATMGSGRIDLNQARFRSASLEGGIKGPIPIADDLMKSPLNFPVDVALNRELAQRARLVSGSTATNSNYVAIPNIVALKGTVGAPAAEIDKVKAGLLLARGIGGLVDSRAGDTIKGAADLVGGVTQGGSNAVGNLIQGIGGLLGGNRARGDTNAANATNTGVPQAGGTNAAATNTVKDPIGGLLRNLLEKKKE